MMPRVHFATARDPDAQWFPAPLTTLMIAYVTFQALKACHADTKVICPRAARCNRRRSSDFQSSARSPLKIL